jgi:hypothetical protein
MGAGVNYQSLKEKTLANQVGDLLRVDENPFSTNKVTGHSINYPIAPTCVPTKVCAKTCYFGAGPSTWTAALKKQLRLYNSTVADPASVAESIAKWAVRLRLDFVRWNGGGDLFDESVECINHAASLMPSIPQWVVTRLPHRAVNIVPSPNVFVHFSVDRGSWTRVAAMRQYPGNWFWSYQCDSGEKPPKSLAPVVFYDGYEPGEESINGDDCPLNSAADISGTCGRCRRCFDGTAVRRSKELVAVLDEMIGRSA